MPAENPTTKTVADAVQNAMETDGLQKAVFQFGQTRILFSKARQLQENLPKLEEPPEYPDVPTKLKPEDDSWLK